MFPFPLMTNANIRSPQRVLAGRNGNSTESNSVALETESRRLRLHFGANGDRIDKWTFRPRIAKESCSERMLRFGDVYYNCLDQLNRNRVDGM